MTFDNLRQAIDENHKDDEPTLYSAFCVMDALFSDYKDNGKVSLEDMKSGNGKFVYKFGGFCEKIISIYNKKKTEIDDKDSTIEKLVLSIEEYNKKLEKATVNNIEQEIAAKENELRIITEEYEKKKNEKKRFDELTNKFNDIQEEIKKLPQVDLNELAELQNKYESTKAIIINKYIKDINEKYIEKLVLYSDIGELYKEIDALHKSCEKKEKQKKKLEKRTNDLEKEQMRLVKEIGELKGTAKTSKQLLEMYRVRWDDERKEVIGNIESEKKALDEVLYRMGNYDKEIDKNIDDILKDIADKTIALEGNKNEKLRLENKLEEHKKQTEELKKTIESLTDLNTEIENLKGNNNIEKLKQLEKEKTKERNDLEKINGELKKEEEKIKKIDLEIQENTYKNICVIDKINKIEECIKDKLDMLVRKKEEDYKSANDTNSNYWNDIDDLIQRLDKLDKIAQELEKEGKYLSLPSFIYQTDSGINIRENLKKYQEFVRSKIKEYLSEFKPL